MRRMLILAVVAASLGVVSPAAAAKCGTAILRDWSDGKLDRTYPVRCYQDALDAMPEDMRSYTSAPDDIKRALLARLRTARTHHGELRGRSRPATSTPRTTAREAGCENCGPGKTFVASRRPAATVGQAVPDDSETSGTA